MKRYSLPILIALLGIMLLLFWLPVDQKLLSQGEVRAAIDIGSGSTNLKIAKVDVKSNKIIQPLYEKSIPVPYQKHLEQSSNGTFDQEVMEQGIQSIQTLKEIANTYQVKKVIAIATAAFRKAENAQQFAKEIEAKTGVQVRIIDQDEEGILAFRGALAVTTAEPKHTVTWDIGGGSMQLTTLSEDGTYLVEKGKTASIPFKNAIIQQIKGEEIQTTQSPNPMSKEQMEQAIAMAKGIAQQTDLYIKSKLHDAQTRVLAVGSLFNFGIGPLVEDSLIRVNGLEEAVMKMSDKTDAQLPGGSLAEVAVSNPLLVVGFMHGLDIQQAQIVNVNNADGALTYPPYWMTY